jgi:hypothetical protein
MFQNTSGPESITLLRSCPLSEGMASRSAVVGSAPTPPRLRCCGLSPVLSCGFLGPGQLCSMTTIAPALPGSCTGCLIAELEVASETSVIECSTGALRGEEEGWGVRPGGPRPACQFRTDRLYYGMTAVVKEF